MPSYLLHHHHDPADCAAAFAAWTGFESPLRHRTAVSTCLTGGHSVMWHVEASDQAAALALLPRYVRRRTEVSATRDVQIP